MTRLGGKMSFADAYVAKKSSLVYETESRKCHFKLFDGPDIEFTGTGPALEMFDLFLRINFRTRNSQEFVVYAPNGLASGLEKLGKQLNENVYVVKRDHLLAMRNRGLRRVDMDFWTHQKYLGVMDFGSIPWRIWPIPADLPEDTSLYFVLVNTSTPALRIPPLAREPKYELRDRILGRSPEVVDHLKAIDQAIGEWIVGLPNETPATLLQPGVTPQGGRLDVLLGGAGK